MSTPFGPGASSGTTATIRKATIIFKNVIFVLGIAFLIWLDIKYAGQYYGLVLGGGLPPKAAHQQGLEISLVTSAIDIVFWTFGLWQGWKGKQTDLIHKFGIVAAVIVMLVDTTAGMAGFAHLAHPSTPADQFFPSHMLLGFWMVDGLIGVLIAASTPLTALFIDYGITGSKPRT